jgi:ribonuclease-3 family protein
MGFEKWWLPPAPEVKKPRSLYNAASLAYLGDCIYEVRIGHLIIWSLQTYSCCY